MKTRKSIGLMLALLFSANLFAACYPDEKPIQVTQLPQEAQTFLSTHFNGVKVLSVLKERELISYEYTVHFDNGTKLEFDGKGRWTLIEHPSEALPASILRLLPVSIPEFVAAQYPGTSIRKIDADERDYEIGLTNKKDFELKFTKTGIFLKTDD